MLLSNLVAKFFKKSRSTRPACRLVLEQLEDRLAPAAVIYKASYTFTDVDGDLVTIKTSRGTNADLAAAVTLEQRGIANQLTRLNLANPVFAGSDVSITAVPLIFAGIKYGDSFVNVGWIDAGALDLGAVTVKGDLGAILCGSGTAAAMGLKSLSVHSLFKYGATTGAPSQQSSINASLGALKVQTNIGGYVAVGGNIGSVTVGGSIIGGDVSDYGRIYAVGNLGPTTVRGDVIGANGARSGSIGAGHAVTSVTIGGSLSGGDGGSAGSVSCGTLGVANLGPVKIGRDVRGAGSSFSGSIISSGGITSVKIGGSLIGGHEDNSGTISGRQIGAVSIGGDIRGGSANDSGNILAQQIGSVTVGGSIIAGIFSGAAHRRSGAVSAYAGIGAITVKGSLVGNGTSYPVVISALGQATPTATTDVAIKSLTVYGNVEHVNILAGYFPDNAPANGDAQVGRVIVGGNWIGSNLAVGVHAGADGRFGTADDARITGPVIDSASTVSMIGSVIIGGQVRGDPGTNNNFGFGAEQVGSFMVGAGPIATDLAAGKPFGKFPLLGAALPLTAGPHNDTFALLAARPVGSSLSPGFNFDGFAVHVFEV